MDGFLIGLTVAAALGAGLVAGAFFAFSSFVMKGLHRLSPAQAVAAMQAINVAAVTFAFMLALFGTAAVCAVVGGWAIVEWGEDHAPLLLAGSAAYLVGTVGLTAAFHVPRNDALAIVEPDRADAADAWNRYRTQWTAANHVRAGAALAAAGLFTFALHVC